MGFGMARNMARAGITVRAWNRTYEKAAPLADDGAELCASPAEAARGADVLVTILSDADAVAEAMTGSEGALDATEHGGIWLQMSTIGEAGTEQCAELAQQHGLAFLDAPVLGTKQPALEGKLTVLASGDEQVRERIDPILEAVGQRTIWVGKAGGGTRLKLVVNSWVLTVVEGGAETIALAEGLGLDPKLLFESIDGGGLDLPYLRMKGEVIAKREFDPSFSLALAAKDAGLIVEAIQRHDLDIPLPGAIRVRLEQGVAEHGDKDFSATYLTSAPR
jgi:3-hydroxyisobutyrate dehydrogenase